MSRTDAKQNQNLFLIILTLLGLSLCRLFLLFNSSFRGLLFRRRNIRMKRTLALALRQNVCVCMYVKSRQKVETAAEIER